MLVVLQKLKKKQTGMKGRMNSKKILDEIRSSDGSHDCIVPWSGGKDSSYIAYLLKFKYKMNPLLVTFCSINFNKIGEHNRMKMIELGFDNLVIKPNQKISSYLSKDFLLNEVIQRFIGMLV